jgi:hypothetical protein
MKTWHKLQYFYMNGRQTSFSWPALSTLERKLGVIPVPAQLVPEAALCAFDFEEFLFQHYFHLWVTFTLAEKLEASPFRPALERFLLQIYTEEGRAQCS